VSYMSMENLYRPRAQRILEFRRLYAMEKVHGTSAHVMYRGGVVHGSSGGAGAKAFEACFDRLALCEAFRALGHDNVTVYGEAYGGKMQGMRHTYGDALRFIAFEVKIGETWLDVPNACDVATKLGLEFVPWVEVEAPTREAMIAALDEQRDAPSQVAVWRGVNVEKPREGIVIRPPFECVSSDGTRLIAKHKGAAFAERAHPPKVVDPGDLEILRDAEAIATEWCTGERLRHVLDALGVVDLAPEHTGKVIAGMVADIEREASGEAELTREARKAIGTAAARLYKEAQKASLAGGGD